MTEKSAKTADPGPPRRRAGPRAPTRERGVLRYALLLDATENLLSEHRPDDVGLYQIAEKAGIPPASVYHFFPTKEAAFLALAKRYLLAFAELGTRPVPEHALSGWQELMRWDLRLAQDYYNQHPPAMKLFYGGYGGMQSREAEIRYNARVARHAYRRFDAAFHMPFLREPEKTFHINLGILDAVWAISYLQEGEITEDYFIEAHSACVAYCRLVLPEQVELREAHKVALQRGDPVVLAPPAMGDPAPD